MLLLLVACYNDVLPVFTYETGDTATCPPLDVDPTPSPDATAGTFDPSWVQLTVAVDHQGGALGDYLYDVDRDGTDEAQSGGLTFVFYDADGQVVCSVLYDEAVFTPVAPDWATDSGGALYVAWEAELAGGASDCPGLAPAWGATDVRDVLARHAWGVGWGEMKGLSQELADYLASQGVDWSREFGPYHEGFYVTTDRELAVELGYSYAYPTDCGVVGDALLPEIDAAPLPDALVEGWSWDVLPWASLAGG